MTGTVRRATTADAEGVCAAIRRSIAESCGADHGGDAAVLEWWLANKTPKSACLWIAGPETYSVVAELDGAVVGFAMLMPHGEVSLCYLVPEAQGLGLGRSMMAALEAEALRRKLPEVGLWSTKTAHGFYLRLGFVDAGGPQQGRFIVAQPMKKVRV